MITQGGDIWFGPGGTRGVFGAGVAQGLERQLRQGRLQADRLRLFGSSVGCLNAVFLATGNTGCGLSIFRDDAGQVVRLDHLWPGLATRLYNQWDRWTAGGRGQRRVPAVVDVEHVLSVMHRRVPAILDQLRGSAMPVYAEVLDRRSGQYEHVELRSAEDPLAWIRRSMHCSPFYCDPEAPHLLDSAVHGPGFVRLLDTPATRRLIVVLNHDPWRGRTRQLAADLLAALLAACPRLSCYYLGRQGRCRAAWRATRREPHRVLLVYPARRPDTAGGVERRYTEGLAAAEHIAQFLQAELVPEPAPHGHRARSAGSAWSRQETESCREGGG